MLPVTARAPKTKTHAIMFFCASVFAQQLYLVAKQKIEYIKWP